MQRPFVVVGAAKGNKNGVLPKKEFVESKFIEIEK
jgi:hypothetical protein